MAILGLGWIVSLHESCIASAANLTEGFAGQGDWRCHVPASSQGWCLAVVPVLEWLSLLGLFIEAL